MSRCPGSWGSKIVLAGMGFDEADEVPDRLHRQRRMNCEHRGCSDRDRDWVEIFVGIVGDLVIQGRVDDEVGRNNEYGIAVRCCPCPLTHSDVAAGTTNVFDIELFSEMLGQLLCDETGEYVGWTGVRTARSPEQTASDRIAPARYATRPGARQRPLPDAKIDGAAGSWRLAPRQAHGEHRTFARLARHRHIA